MGINTSFAHLLVLAKSQGANFRDTLTIGKQSLTVPRSELKALAATLGLDPTKNNSENEFADNFIKSTLSAHSLTSMDYSDYQNADIVHDLNQPIPEALKNKYDTLIDGGSIEHIFDIKQVLSNYMDLIKPDGNIFILTNANNLCGHGFYQFSPEFFYRVFEKTNGFKIKEMILIESPLLSTGKTTHTRCYRVNDPMQVGKRVQLINKNPTMIFVHAEKISAATPFCNPPLQSDYSNTKWERRSPQSCATAATTHYEFKYLSKWEILSRRFKQWRKNSYRNTRFFKNIKL